MTFCKIAVSLLCIHFSLCSAAQRNGNNDIEDLDGRKIFCIPLNPAKGWTIYAPEKTLAVSWASYDDFKCIKAVEENIPGDYEITLSPFTFKGDYLRLLNGLLAYNISKLDPRYIFGAQVFKDKNSSLSGEVMGESTIVENLTLGNLTHLSSLEKQAFEKGGRRVFIPLHNYKKGLRPLLKMDEKSEKIAQSLQQNDYKDCDGAINFKTGAYNSVFMKELSEEYTFFPENTLTLDWKSDEISIEAGMLANFFGIFVRDQKGSVQGGVWGNIQKKAHIPHAYINIFFMDGSIRGTGYGRLVMIEAEKYVKGLGIHFMLLGTNDYQAPRFYERIGYQKLSTLPKISQLKNGTYDNGYSYFKEL